MTSPATDSDPVTVLLAFLRKGKLELFVDGNDCPAIKIHADHFRQEHRLFDGRGAINPRVRAWLRAQYREAAPQGGHLADGDLKLVADYLADEAHGMAPRPTTPVACPKSAACDHTFESVAIFMNAPSAPEHPSLELMKDLGMDMVLDECLIKKLAATVTITRERDTTIYEGRTAALWLSVNAAAIQSQVSRANPTTRFKNLNQFSRRLTELNEAFRSIGLEVTVGHRESGSWVQIIRHDDEFMPEPDFGVPDDVAASASGLASGRNCRPRSGLLLTDATTIEFDPPTWR